MIESLLSDTSKDSSMVTRHKKVVWSLSENMYRVAHDTVYTSIKAFFQPEILQALFLQRIAYESPPRLCQLIDQLLITVAEVPWADSLDKIVCQARTRRDSRAGFIGLLEGVGDDTPYQFK